MDLTGGKTSQRTSVVVFDVKSLLTECLVCALEAVEPAIQFEHHPGLSERLADASKPVPSLVVICLRQGSNDTSSAIAARVEELKSYKAKMNFAVLSDMEDVEGITSALALGARGFIPTNLALRVVVQALRLIMAGGIFVPSASLLAMSSSWHDVAKHPAEPTSMVLSVKEIAVADALRKGTPNKVIAHDLGLGESTVKLLVRRVMRKLKARNRTEVAYLTNSMFTHK